MNYIIRTGLTITIAASFAGSNEMRIYNVGDLRVTVPANSNSIGALPGSNIRIVDKRDDSLVLATNENNTTLMVGGIIVSIGSTLQDLLVQVGKAIMSSAISREEADLTAPLSSTQAFETWGLKSGSVDFTVTGWASTITMVIAISNDDPAGAVYYSEHTSLDIASDGNYSMQLPTGYNLVKLTWKSGSATAMENITFFGGF